MNDLFEIRMQADIDTETGKQAGRSRPRRDDGDAGVDRVTAVVEGDADSVASPVDRDDIAPDNR
jgi:hypothetical protein